MLTHKALLRMAFALIAATTLRGSVSAGQETIDVIRNAHQAAVQSIQTLHCRLEVIEKVDGSRASGEYWRSPDCVRIRWSSRGQQRDMVMKNGVVTTFSSVMRKGRQEPIVVITKGSGMPLSDCDAWHHALMTSLPERPEDPAPQAFSDLISKMEKQSRLEHRSDSGKRFISIHFSRYKDQTEELWFDPGVNYLVRKRIHSTSSREANSGTIRTEHEVVRYKECVPGVYFPEVATFKCYRNDNLFFSRETKFSAIEVNRPLSSDLFATRYLKGMTVLDNISGTQYSVDAEGRRIGAATVLPDVPPPPAGETLRGETREEPKSMLRWILPASIGVLAAAGCLWVVRKWRASSTRSMGN